MALIEKLRALADAIRAKTGATDTLTLDQMKAEVENFAAVEEGEIPRPYVDSSKITSLRNFCYGGANLEMLSNPNFDISSVTDFSYFFEQCGLRQLPHMKLDTSSATKMSYMFYYVGCQTGGLADYGMDISFLELDMTNVTDVSLMFDHCGMGKPPILKKTEKITNANLMFGRCYYLQEVDLPETAAVTNFSAMFLECVAIKRINVNMCAANNYASMFQSCGELTDLSIGSLKIRDNNFRLDHSPKLTVESLVRVLEAFENNAGDEYGPYTVYLGSDNLAKLTDEQKLIAAEKNITLA